MMQSGSNLTCHVLFSIWSTKILATGPLGGNIGLPYKMVRIIANPENAMVLK
jgi:hypothetical protein